VNADGQTRTFYARFHVVLGGTIIAQLTIAAVRSHASTRHTEVYPEVRHISGQALPGIAYASYEEEEDCSHWKTAPRTPTECQ